MPDISTIESKVSPTQLTDFLDNLVAYDKKEKEKNEMDRILGEYQQNMGDANSWEKMMMDIERSDMAPSSRVQRVQEMNQIGQVINTRQEKINKQLTEQKKKEQDKLASTAYFKKAGYSDEEAAELGSQYSAKDAKALTSTDKLDPYDTVQKKKGAEMKDKLITEYNKSQDMLKNLSDVRNIFNENLTGAKGYIKSALGTESATKVKNLSAASLDNIIKLFNPSGQLPMGKLDWIKNTFAVNPSDLKGTMEGKVAVLEILQNQAAERASKMIKLLDQYKGAIPADVLINFDKETESLLDILKENFSPEQTEKPMKPRTDGKIHVKHKESGKVGFVTPYEGIELDYDSI